jgi:hypothetical protein
VLAHARALLTGDEAGATEYIDSDLRDTPTILSQAAQLPDFTRPVAVTLLSVLHAVLDADDPYAIVATLMDAVPSGSYLAISHGFHAEHDVLESCLYALRGSSGRHAPRRGGTATSKLVARVGQS